MRPNLRKPAPRESALVDLLAECHGRIRHFTALACAVAERTDAPHDHIAQACDDVRRYLTEALPLHVADENDSIAPRMRARDALLDAALATMEREHDAHLLLLAELVAALAAVREAPAELSRRARLGEASRRVRDELEAHLVAEEQTVFPALARLDGGVQAEIVRELRARRGG